MALRGIFQNSYSYLFLGCVGTLGGLMLAIAAQANSEPLAEPLPDAYPGIAQPDCPDQTQTRLNICAYEWELATDSRRDSVYNELASTLTPEQQSELEQVESAWSLFETNYCRLMSDPYRGGTIQPLILGTCRAQQDNERIETLLQWGSAEADYETVTAQVENAYQLALQNGSAYAQKRLPLNQTFWKIYQTRQCNWEAAQADAQQREQCLTRLSQQRLSHLLLF